MREQVKRYDAVHIRYEDNNIRYGEGCEVEMVTAADYEREVRIAIAAGQRMQDKCDALHAEAESLENQRAEQWRLRREAEARCDTQSAVIAQIKAEAEALRAENGRLRQSSQDVRALVEAAQQADDVLSAIVRNDQPIETLRREYGEEWSSAIDTVRASLVTQIAAHRQAQSQA